MQSPSFLFGRCMVAGLFFMSLPACPAQTRTAPPPDSALLARVEHTLNREPAFAGLAMVPTVARGVVTLEGTVDSQAAKNLASNEVGAVAGVRTVLNNLNVVAGGAVQPAIQPAIQPAVQPATQPADGNETSGVITLPAETVLPVRLGDELNTKTAQVGDTFHGTVAASVSVSNYVLIASGTPVTGRVVEAKEAGRFAGAAELTLELTSVRLAGQDGVSGLQEVALSTSPWSSRAAARGANTVEKTGGGAAVGAIIGALAGGGQGAAIGAASGGALGAGSNALTRGKEIRYKPEQLLQFRTSAPLDVTVRLRNGAQVQARAVANPSLETRPAGPLQLLR